MAANNSSANGCSWLKYLCHYNIEIVPLLKLLQYLSAQSID
jgi:hypothetical protein